MTIIEQIKTTKGAYTVEIGIRENGDAFVSISDPETEMIARLDCVDLRRIYLLLSDHKKLFNDK